MATPHLKKPMPRDLPIGPDHHRSRRLDRNAAKHLRSEHTGDDGGKRPAAERHRRKALLSRFWSDGVDEDDDVE